MRRGRSQTDNGYVVQVCWQSPRSGHKPNPQAVAKLAQHASSPAFNVDRDSAASIEKS